jgi:hypothetical protein
MFIYLFIPLALPGIGTLVNAAFNYQRARSPEPSDPFQIFHIPSLIRIIFIMKGRIFSQDFPCGVLLSRTKSAGSIAQRDNPHSLVFGSTPRYPT